MSPLSHAEAAETLLADSYNEPLTSEERIALRLAALVNAVLALRDTV